MKALPTTAELLLAGYTDAGTFLVELRANPAAYVYRRDPNTRYREESLPARNALVYRLVCARALSLSLSYLSFFPHTPRRVCTLFPCGGTPCAGPFPTLFP